MKVHLAIAALCAAFLVSSPARSFADDKAADKAAQAAKEKREKELAKAKEEVEKKLRTKKVDPAPAVSFLATLVQSADVEVGKAKELLDRVLSKKIPFEEALKGLDKVIAENPKDPKKVTKELGDWIGKWKPEKKSDEKKPDEKKPDEKKPDEPKKGDKK